MYRKLLAEAMQPCVDRGLFAGAVMGVTDREGTLAVETIGKADVAGGVPMGEDALFWIASITKPITATAFMMLVDEGKVRVDDPVSDYLPKLGELLVQAMPEDEPRRPSRPILLRDVLAHISGLPFGAPEEVPLRDRLTSAESVACYARLRLKSDPGAGYIYSNAGINIAARVMEIVSGEPYEAFLQRRILDPLGMRNAVFRPAGGQLARLAKSYKATPDKTGLEEVQIDQLSHPLDRPERQPMAAGGLFSTVDDLLRFSRMILRGGEADGRRYLSLESLRTMTTKQTGELENGYGLGWSVAADGYGHGGAYKTEMWVNPGAGHARVFLVQQCGDWSGVGHGLEVIPMFARAAEDLAAGR